MTNSFASAGSGAGRGACLICWCALAATPPAPAALITGVDPQVSFRTVTTDAFAGNDINVVANARNTVISSGNYQYVAYYGTDPAPANPTFPYSVYVARRTVTDPNSQFVPVKLSVNNLSAAGIADDHRAISMAIDNGGFLHVSYGMHNNNMQYRISNRSAKAATWPNFSSFFQYTTYTDFGGQNTNVTYPEFTRIPGSDDLLYTWRVGGSGNGDMYLSRVTYTPAPAPKLFTFTPPTLLMAGTQTNDSAYTNNFVYNGSGDLMMSWTWRETPGYQSNHDILFAKSKDNGATWTDVKGNPLATPFSVYDATTHPNGTRPAIDLPANSSLINTTTMAADKAGNPVIATWYAPNHAQGDDTRQYMLAYYDGTDWKTSQITHRPAEALTTDDDVRELGRPLVLVDKDDRTIVLMRYRNDIEDPSNPDPLAGNRLVAAYSSDKVHWDYVTLVNGDLGNFEPAGYDQDLWAAQNKLSLLYQATNADGSFAPTLSTLEWDAPAFFAAVPEPSTAAWVTLVAVPAVLRRRRTW